MTELQATVLELQQRVETLTVEKAARKAARKAAKNKPQKVLESFLLESPVSAERVNKELEHKALMNYSLDVDYVVGKPYVDLLLEKKLRSGLEKPIVVLKGRDHLEGLIFPAQEHSTFRQVLSGIGITDNDTVLVDVRYTDHNGDRDKMSVTIPEFLKLSENPSCPRSPLNVIDLNVEQFGKIASSKVSIPLFLEKVSVGHRVRDAIPIPLRKDVTDANCMDTTLYHTKYVLLSQKGAYTAFHKDFTGTLVCYTVISGKKRFTVLRPTQENMDAFNDK